METRLKRTWAEIDLDALAHNYHTLRNRCGKDVRFLGVVKANAYGHGSQWISRELQDLGTDYLAVSNVEEALELRHAGVEIPILVLGYTPPIMTHLLLEQRVTQCVPDLATAIELSQEATALGGTLKIHIKLDTGMSRLGFLCDAPHFAESLAEILQVLQLPSLEAEGIFTHFAVADEEGEDCDAYTHLQHQRFTEMLTAITEQTGYVFPLRHCANSGGVANHPTFYENMVRPGILLYGVGEAAKQLGLKPVMTLKSTLSTWKEVEENTSVSYGRRFTATQTMRIGVIPVGYADGLQRCLSDKWTFWTEQGSLPILGRICMDMCMVDLAQAPDLQVGDEVEIFGVHNDIELAGHLAETISYELMCAIPRRVPRLYLRQGKEVGYQNDLHL